MPISTPTLSSVSPSFGPPGTAITLTGTGFAAGATVACPTAVATAVVSATAVTAEIPESLTGAAGGSMVVSVLVVNADGGMTGVLPFEVRFPVAGASMWTTVSKVCGEVPAFRRGGQIADATIEVWIKSVAQAVNAAMLRRGYSLDAAAWYAAASGADLVEMINRLGAAARLAAAMASGFTGQQTGIAASLQREYERELKKLDEGAYDKLFVGTAAATAETAAQFTAGDISRPDGGSDAAFTKGQVF